MEDKNIKCVPKVTRRTLSFPVEDDLLIDEFQKRCMLTGDYRNQSEIIRAALHALQRLEEKEFFEIVSNVRRIKGSK